jgi:hypothetical protein
MPDSPEKLLSQWENTDSLFVPDQLPLRLEILDRLEVLDQPEVSDQSAGPGQLDARFPESGPAIVSARARRLRARLEAANVELYASIRSSIRQGSVPAAFARQLEPTPIQPGGLHYGYLDELVAGVFAFDQPGEARAPAGPENVFYQPTPARHIFSLIRQAGIAARDVLLDLGSGLGHVPLLVSASTSARAIGVEFEPAYVASARSCAQKLNLDRVSFLLEDARDADLSIATVFYLYTPFTGSILRTVLYRLRAQANLRAQAEQKVKAAPRPIRICTFGPCTITVAQQRWLVPDTSPAEDRITVFRARS